MVVTTVYSMAGLDNVAGPHWRTVYDAETALVGCCWLLMDDRSLGHYELRPSVRSSAQDDDHDTTSSREFAESLLHRCVFLWLSREIAARKNRSTVVEDKGRTVSNGICNLVGC